MESGAGSGGGGRGFYRTAFSHYNSGGKLPELGIGIGLTPLPPMSSNGRGQPPSSSYVDAPPAGHGLVCTVREQDRFMPIANIIRIMRKMLPQHAKISDDAKETIQECVSEFISFITGEANERCQREQRKTITAEDVLWAMNKLGFDDYIEPLTMYLHRSRLFESGDHKGFKDAAAAAAAAAAAEHFRLPGLPPLSPTPYAARPPPSFGHHQPPTGFFIPTPVTPGNGGFSTATTSKNRSSNGTASSSGTKQGSGNA